MPRLLKVIVIVLVFAALAGGSAYLTIMMIVKGEKSVVVPDLTGKDVVYALQLLSDLGLNTKVTGAEYHDTVATHHIIFQKPSPGSEIKKGRDVRLIISKGPLRTVVPRLVGTRLENARAVLEENGLCLGQLSRWHTDDALAGQITAQEPLAGAQLLRKDCVNLLVSLGPPARGFVMPPLTGLPFEEAILAAEQSGLSVTDILRERRPDLSEDIVLAQSPRTGYRMAAGGSVSLVVNGARHGGPGRASAKSMRSGFFRHRLAPGFLRQHVRLHLVGSGISVDLFDEYVAPGTELWFMVPVTGHTTATLYVDGVPVERAKTD